MLLKHVDAGAVITFQTNYVGQFLVLSGQSNQDIDVNAVKVTPLGDGVLCDLDKAGVNIVGTNRLISTFAAFTNNNLRIIPLADGVIPGKVTDITIDNTDGVGWVKVFMPVMGKGTTYVRTLMQTVLASSQSTFVDFSFLGIDNGPGDNEANQVTVDYEDGGSHTFDLQELISLSSYIQDVNKPIIDNIEGTIRKVTIIPDVDRKVYLQRFDAVGNF